MQTQIGEDEPGIQEHTLGLDRRPVDLAITRHLTLTDHRTHHNPLHRKLGFPVSKALTTRLPLQLYHVLHPVLCMLTLHNAPLLTMHQSSPYQVLATGSA